jgi:N-methylhydantoinase A
VSIERGFDPRQFTFFSFGGTSPLFQSEICRTLRIADIVVPGDSSGFCARGLLEADRSESYVESLYWTSERPLEELNPVFERLEERARSDFADQGYAPGDLTVVREGDLRFAGQWSELTIPLPPGRLGEAEARLIEERFVETYETLYGPGTAWTGAAIEIQNCRLSVVAPSQTFSVEHRRRGEDTSGEPVEVRRAYVPSEGAMGDVPVYAGERLPARWASRGPALIELPYTVVYVAPDEDVALDDADNFRITRSEKG